MKGVEGNTNQKTFPDVFASIKELVKVLKALK